MAKYLLQGLPIRQLDDNVDPLAGARLYTYAAGTTTPLATYTDSGGGTPLANPIEADLSGNFPQIWVSASSYRLQCRKSDDVSIIYDVDNINAPGADAALAVAALTASLANSADTAAGDALIAVKLDAASSVASTQHEVNARRISIFDFMSTAQIADYKARTFSLDLTAPIQNAINSLTAGDHLDLGAGAAKITSALTCATAGVHVIGRGHWATEIKQYTTNAKIFNVTADHVEIAGVKLNYDGTPASGATAVATSGSWCRYHHIWIHACYIGISCTTGVGVRAWDLDIRNYVSSAFIANGLNDLFLRDFIFDAGNATNGALGGIRLLNKCEAFVAQSGDILNGVYSLTTDGTWGIGTRPAYNSFTNIFFDSAASGSLLDKMVETTFTDCWFSGGRSGAGSPGLAISQCDSLTFVKPRFFNCGSHGCLVSSSANNTHFVAPNANSNSVTAGAGVANGIAFANSAHDFSIHGGCCTNGLFSGTQGYGVSIGSGCSNYTIHGLSVAGNATGGISDLSGAATGSIAKCIGFVTANSGTAQINSGSSSVAVSHGLAVTPNAQDILITPTTPMGSNPFYVDTTTITSTQFTVKTNTNVGANSLFIWSVRAKGS